jgi:branched-chain amino acid transport system permease protein
MFYREAGQFKTNYGNDQAIFPLKQDRIGIMILIFVGLVLVPIFGTDYLLSTWLIPMLIYALAALGLNILTGYAGQISLGTGGFMAVGAYVAFKLASNIPELNFLVAFLCGGLAAAGVGIVFGIPSLRIKGFYLAVATLAAQFFLDWVFLKFDWWVNHNLSGVVAMPEMTFFAFSFDTPEKKYILTAVIVIMLALAVKNVVRSHIGRAWMAVRDQDVAAEMIGIRLLQTKLSAFALSSFICGIAGAMWAFIYLGTLEGVEAFNINTSFTILFMVIIGGAGSIMGSFFGAAFIMLVPIFINLIPSTLGVPVAIDTISHFEVMIFGSMIIFFLIVEPLGLARLWSIGKEKIRLWPFPH